MCNNQEDFEKQEKKKLLSLCTSSVTKPQQSTPKSHSRRSMKNSKEIEDEKQSSTPKSRSKESKKKLNKIDAAKQNDDEQVMSVKDELETKLSDPIDIQTQPSTSKSIFGESVKKLQEIEAGEQKSDEPLMPQDTLETTTPEACGTIVEPDSQIQESTFKGLSRRSKKNLKKKQLKKQFNDGRTTFSKDPLETQPTSTKSLKSGIEKETKKEQALSSMPKKGPKRSDKENPEEETTKKGAKEGGKKVSKKNKTKKPVNDELAATSTKRLENQQLQENSEEIARQQNKNTDSKVSGKKNSKENLNNNLENITDSTPTVKQNENISQAATEKNDHESPSTEALVPLQDSDTQLEDTEEIEIPSFLNPFHTAHILRAVNYMLRTNPEIHRILHEAYYKSCDEAFKK